MLRLDKHRRHADTPDRQRIIDEPLAIALYEVEAPHLLLGQGHVRHAVPIVGHHLVVQHVPEQPHPSLRKIVVHAAVDVRHVHSAVDQHRYGPEQIGSQVAETEIAGIGHDADIQRLGHRLVDRIGSGQRLDQLIDDIGSRTGVRIGKLHRITVHRRMQVMVDQYALGRRIGRRRIGHPVEPVDLIEIHAKDHVRLADELRHLPVRILLENPDIPDIGHPFEKIRVPVRRDAARRMPQTFEVRAPRQRGADRIAVRIGM